MPHEPGRYLGFRRPFLIFLLLLGFLLPAQPAHAALKGVALVIGQSTYEALPALPNPEQDARSMEILLTKLGFETDLVTSEKAKKLRRTIDGFIADAGDADVALIYYSGHAVEAGGVNYLIPVDAGPSSAQSAGENFISVQEILERLRGRTRITILLLDACRTNPFPPGAQLKRDPQSPDLPIAAAGLGAPRGLRPLESSPAPESFGEVIGFAAEPGKVALDGAAGDHSPYAAALLKHLDANQGYDFAQVMTMVTEEVYLATATRQRPWVNASLRRFLTFGDPPHGATADEAALTSERRKLLLSIAATPQNIRQTVESLAKERSLPLDPLYGMLKELQVDTTAGPQELEKQLRIGAENLQKLLAEKVTPLRRDRELNRLASLADRAQQEGAIGLAKTYRAQASARADELGKTLDLREADVIADRIELASTYADAADTALLAFDFLLASGQYHKAYQQVADKDAALAFNYRLREAIALQQHGNYQGDNEALRRAIELYEAMLTTTTEETDPDKWVTLQNNLGVALLYLGERKMSTEDLGRAVAAYESVLRQLTREKDPLGWAKLQNNLGNVFRLLGERGGGVENFRKSVAAFEAALSVITRRQMPASWALTQSNLGNVLRSLSDFEPHGDHLHRAIAAYKAALAVQPQDRDPLDWAKTQIGLGNALIALSRQEDNSTRFIEAIAALESALNVVTRDNAPQMWATVQFNLGDALLLSSKQEARTDALHKAALAFEASLDIRKREFFPELWAITAFKYATVLEALDAREKNTESLAQAVLLYEQVLQVWTEERDPGNWIKAQMSLAFSAQKLGERESSPEPFTKAIAAYEAALPRLSREQNPSFWAHSQIMLGLAKLALGKRKNDKPLILSSRQSLTVGREALQALGDTSSDPTLNAAINEIDAILTGK